jgi:hypothetical protein
MLAVQAPVAGYGLHDTNLTEGNKLALRVEKVF